MLLIHRLDGGLLPTHEYATPLLMSIPALLGPSGGISGIAHCHGFLLLRAHAKERLLLVKGRKKRPILESLSRQFASHQSLPRPIL
jgi:hypothetical protein